MLIVRVKQVTETEFKTYFCVSVSCEENSLHILTHGNTKNKRNPYIKTSSLKGKTHSHRLRWHIRWCSTVLLLERDAAVLGVDTTFNLCNLWTKDTSYRNKRLVNPRTGDNPVFLGPALLHFTYFLQIALEMLAIKSEIVNLKKIGVDMEDAIFNGMKSIFKQLTSLLCVKHLRGWVQKN